MKACFLKIVAFAAGVLGGGILPLQAAAPEPPRIQTVRLSGRTMVVTVLVPPGLRKLTLESRTRLGAGAWVPRAVERIEGAGGVVTFRIPVVEGMELLRVRGDAAEPLPAAFYEGPQEFGGPISSEPLGPLVREGAFDTTPGGPLNPVEGDPGGASRAVVESDIWRLVGNTLYFFNQYRGLQVIRLEPPGTPTLAGTLPLSTAGEQLYVVTQPADGTDRVVLLTRPGCGWEGAEFSEVLIVHPAPAGKDQPAITARVRVPGALQESRLVGSALYVASQTYRRLVPPPKSGAGDQLEQWEYGLQIAALDLADPDVPQLRDPLWLPGYGHTVHATDRYLFVVVQDPQDGWRSRVRLVDISAPDGTLRAAGELVPAGQVSDKFKMHLAGEVFTVISEVNRWSSQGRQVSVLETFSLADPQQPRKLGALEVGHGEGLYATRFDGTRAYLVTFLRMDPLWVVDLSDPARPRVSGELEVPGWSTYIHPLGDRLVTVGIEDVNAWRVAISLFDVRDPARPALLARVPLGETHSWSEATQDEKAFTVLPEAGLILVPYQSWETNQTIARVQLIDLGADTLTPRGVIDHAFQPRRATWHGERILSVSGRELLSVDARDRDHPVVAAQLELAWPVDWVVPVGEYLVEVTQGGEVFEPGPSGPMLRVVRAAQPEVTLARLPLPAGMPVIYAGNLGSAGVIVQGEFGGRPVPWDTKALAGEPPSRLRVTTLDWQALPALEPLGSLETRVAPLGAWGQWQALQPRPDLLVLAWRGGSAWWWGGGGGLWAEGAPTLPVWWGGGAAGRLLALDVADPAVPQLVSDLELLPKSAGWGGSAYFTADGLVFRSHQDSEFLDGVRLPGQAPPKPYEVTLPDGTRQTVTPPDGVWVTRHYLDVVDYADAANPTVRPPVNLPGELIGVSAGGALLFTRGTHWTEAGQTDGRLFVDACAYDGVAVSQVASLPLPAEWPQAVTLAGNRVCLARPAQLPETGGRLEVWRLSEAGAFQLEARAALPAPAQDLHWLEPLLLARGNGQLTVLASDVADAWSVVGGPASTGCAWPDLSRAAAQPGVAVWLPLGEYGVLTVPLK